MPVTIEPLGENVSQLQKNAIEDGGLRRSDRNKRPPVAHGFNEYADSANCGTAPFVAYTTCHIQEQKSFEEAIQRDQSECCKQAAEIDCCITRNETWDSVELLLERKPIVCRWIFRSSGAVKGRLVAKGYSQRYGSDYDKTFGNVVKFSSL